MKKSRIVAGLMVSMLCMFGLPVQAKETNYEGRLVAARGIDDLSIAVKIRSGKTVEAYCKGKVCDVLQVVADDDGMKLPKKFKNRKVKITVQRLRNNGEVAGPSADEMLDFVTHLTLL